MPHGANHEQSGLYATARCVRLRCKEVVTHTHYSQSPSQHRQLCKVKTKHIQYHVQSHVEDKWTLQLPQQHTTTMTIHRRTGTIVISSTSITILRQSCPPGDTSRSQYYYCYSLLRISAAIPKRRSNETLHTTTTHFGHLSSWFNLLE